MSERALVCVLGQTRAHKLTWDSFEKNVLSELNADLAVCIGIDDTYDYDNPYFKNAKFRWLLREPEDYLAELERIRLCLGYLEDWRILLTIGGHFFGGIAQTKGSGGISLIFRWLLRDAILRGRLAERYDRFVITRSDFIYEAPHPPLDALDPGFIWLPDGENHGGLVDRHWVLNPADAVQSQGIIEDMLRDPQQWAREIEKRPEVIRNIESTIKIYFTKHWLLSRVRRFPYFMFAARGDDDPTRWAVGFQSPEHNFRIKYPAEYELVQKNKAHFTSSADWKAWAQKTNPTLTPDAYFSDTSPTQR